MKTVVQHLPEEILTEESLEIAEPATLPASTRTWVEVWRTGLAPQLPTAGLVALAAALRADDSRLIQGLSFRNVGQCVECACAITFAGWQSDQGINTTEDVERFFARTCYTADEILNETAVVRHWFAWYDDTPRAEMIAALLPEVLLALAARHSAAAA